MVRRSSSGSNVPKTNGFIAYARYSSESSTTYFGSTLIFSVEIQVRLKVLLRQREHSCRVKRIERIAGRRVDTMAPSRRRGLPPRGSCTRSAFRTRSSPARYSYRHPARIGTCGKRCGIHRSGRRCSISGIGGALRAHGRRRDRNEKRSCRHRSRESHRVHGDAMSFARVTHGFAVVDATADVSAASRVRTAGSCGSDFGVSDT